MTTEQLEKLLALYKKAVANNLTAREFSDEIQQAKIKLDESFVQKGREDENLGKYLAELYELQKTTTNE